MGAVRHFLRVDPESLERKEEPSDEDDDSSEDEDATWGRSLRTEVGNFGEDE